MIRYVITQTVYREREMKDYRNSAYIFTILKKFLSTSASHGLAVRLVHVPFWSKLGLQGISTKSTNSGSLISMWSSFMRNISNMTLPTNNENEANCVQKKNKN